MKPPGANKAKYIALSLAAAVVSYMLPLTTGSQKAMLFVMILTVGLWITEAVPLHATAILVAFLLTAVAGLNSRDVFAQYFDPVIVLLLGGFVIAVAMSKHDLDKYVAHSIISRAKSPRMVVLALIATSTFLSMWISNSATAAIIMPLALVILGRNRIKHGSNFGKASVLAVAYGATIGGVGTIIGSTPNVIAAKFLADSGVAFGFYEWFYRGFPFMIIMMLFGWLALVSLYKPEKRNIITIKRRMNFTGEQKKVMLIFLATIALWITESVHGIQNSVVALVPVILFYFTGLLDTDDFLKVDWPTLILVGGGLALGMGIHASSLDSYFASLVSAVSGGQGIVSLFLILGIFGVMLTAFVSNTTAGAVYLPIVVALASSFGAGVTNTVVVAALGVSLDFIFPFGTPPTAIAYATKYVRMKDIAKAGIAISVAGVLILAFVAMFW